MALIHKELVQVRWPLAVLAVSVLALAGGVWVGDVVLDEDIADWGLQFYQYLVTPIFAVMVLSQSLQQEEKNGGFHYLRSLPVTPAAIVGAKHVVAVLVAVGTPILFLGASLVGASQGNLIAWTVVAGITLTLAGLVLFLGFFTGARGIMISLFALVLALNLVSMFVLGQSGLRAHVRALQAFLATPAGAVATIGLGVAVTVLAYLGSVAVFARRDITRLP